MTTQATQQKTTPQLRFPGFEGDWKPTRLGKHVQIFSGRSPSEFDFSDNAPIPFLKVEDLNNCAKYQSESRFYTDDTSGAAPENAVIFPKRGAAILNNKVRIATRPFQMDSNLMAVSASNGELLEEFLYYYVVKTELHRIADTSTIPQLNNKHINPYRITLPSRNEQEKIASFLAIVDEKIAQLERKKALLEDYKKGCMQQLLSGAIRFKDDDGNDFPNWEEKRVGEVLTIGSGQDYKHLGAGDIPVYGTGGYMTSVDDHLYDGESVGIGRKGTIDTPVFLTGKFWTVDTLFYTHSFRDVLPRFVFALFERINWRKHNEASGVPSLSKATIERIKVSIPCLAEQQKIADLMTGLDRRIEMSGTQIRVAKEFKNGLLQQMFV